MTDHIRTVTMTKPEQAAFESGYRNGYTEGYRDAFIDVAEDKPSLMPLYVIFAAGSTCIIAVGYIVWGWG